MYRIINVYPNDHEIEIASIAVAFPNFSISSHLQISTDSTDQMVVSQNRQHGKNMEKTNRNMRTWSEVSQIVPVPR